MGLISIVYSLNFWDSPTRSARSLYVFPSRNGVAQCTSYRSVCLYVYSPSFLGKSKSNIEILERFQSKVLRLIVDAPWYLSNSVISNDLQIPTVKEEISRFSSHYNVRISVHPNELISSPSRQSKGACVDTGLTTCLSDSSYLYNCISCL
jgi:hypothetical protein